MEVRNLIVRHNEAKMALQANRAERLSDAMPLDRVGILLLSEALKRRAPVRLAL